MSERKLWIDALRGIAMILVVIGHCIPWCYPFFLITSPIKMPLFFVVSGFVFSSKKGNVNKFFSGLFFKIILPWMFLGLLPVLFTIPFKGIENFFHFFCRMVSGESIWFMPCLIIAEVIWFFILKYIRTITSMVIVVSIVSIMGWLFSHCNILTYGMINRAMFVQLFLLFGFFLRRYEEYLSKVNRYSIIVLLCLYVSLIVYSFFFYPGKSIDVHMNMYYNVFICSFLILSGCLAAFIIAPRFTNIPKWLCFVGQNTLIIYIWSPYPINSIHKIMSIMGLIGKYEFLSGLIVSTFAIFICCLCAFFVNRFVPFLVGKKYGK